MDSRVIGALDYHILVLINADRPILISVVLFLKPVSHIEGLVGSGSVR